MKYRFVVFDLDGTIIDNIEYVWKTIHEFLGIEEHPRRVESRDKYMKGEISYYDWAMHDLELMKEHGANRKVILEALHKARLMEGALETLEALKRKGHGLAIISGSISALLEEFIPDYERIFDYVFINRVEFGKDGEIRDVEATKFDMMHKKEGLLEICRLEKLRPEDIAFVGDHDNDVDIAKAAGFSIAFNSKSRELERIADVVIERKDLREILKYLN